MKFVSLLLIFCSLSLFAEDFPLRAEYPEVKPISLTDLTMEYGKVLIVDVRSAFEYDIIHVKNAPNIEESKASFIAKLTEAVGGDKTKKIATYCNGHTCAKSYKAVKKALKEGFTNIFVFDAGIFEWTKTNPDKSFLLGKTPADLTKIIPKEEFAKRELPKEKFEKDAIGPDAFLIDVRDPNQKNKTPPFASKCSNFPFEKLTQLLDNPEFQAKIKGKTLYVFDAVGKQVVWLQYVLEAKGLKNYYFLQKGAWSYFGADGAGE